MGEAVRYIFVIILSYFVTRWTSPLAGAEQTLWEWSFYSIVFSLLLWCFNEIRNYTHWKKQQKENEQ